MGIFSHRRPSHGRFFARQAMGLAPNLCIHLGSFPDEIHDPGRLHFNHTLRSFARDVSELTDDQKRLRSLTGLPHLRVTFSHANGSTPRVAQFASVAAGRKRRSRYHPSPAVTMVAPAPMRLDGTPTIRTSRCPGSSTAVPGTNGARKKGPQ